jgi:DNA-binding transcriptional LysR family regulator
MAMGVRDIDIGLLRAFVAVAETRSVTAAARVVHLSQGAVSQQIKRLETLFDAHLFERNADAMALTAEGERLMVRARRLIALNDEVMEQMRGEDFSGEVRLGVAHDIVAALLPPVLRQFQARRPHVLVTLVSDTSSALRQQLRERHIDLPCSPKHVAPAVTSISSPIRWYGWEPTTAKPIAAAPCPWRWGRNTVLSGLRQPKRSIVPT